MIWEKLFYISALYFDFGRLSYFFYCAFIFLTFKWIFDLSWNLILIIILIMCFDFFNSLSSFLYLSVMHCIIFYSTIMRDASVSAELDAVILSVMQCVQNCCAHEQRQTISLCSKKHSCFIYLCYYFCFQFRLRLLILGRTSTLFYLETRSRWDARLLENPFLL